MIDLSERFAQLDEIETEDMWSEIEFRFQHPIGRVPYPAPRPPRKLAVAGVAAVVVAALIGIAILISSLQSETPPVITKVVPPSTVPNLSTTVTAPSTGSVGDLLDWSITRLPGTVDVDCPADQNQDTPTCVTPFGTVLNDVISVGDGLIAVGHDRSSGQSHGVVLISSDGQSWQRQTLADPLGPGAEDLRAVASGGGTVVAVGAQDCPADIAEISSIAVCPLIWLSEDGGDWERVSQGAIRTADGTSFTASFSEEAFASDNPNVPGEYPMNALVWTGEVFVAAGPALWSSPDGRSWTANPIPSGPGGAGECSPHCWISGLSVTADGIVASGKDPYLPSSSLGGKASLWVSDEGATWSQIQPDSPDYSHFTGVISTGTGYLALGGGGDAFASASDNLRSWEGSRPTSFPGGLYTGRSAEDGLVDGNRIVVVGTQVQARALSEGGAARVYVSSDNGASWEAYPTDDDSLFGAYFSSTAIAGMNAALLFRDRQDKIGWYYTDAAVWTGTWTD